MQTSSISAVPKFVSKTLLFDPVNSIDGIFGPVPLSKEVVEKCVLEYTTATVRAENQRLLFITVFILL